MGNRSLIKGRRTECFFCLANLSIIICIQTLLEHSGSSTLITSYNAHSPLKYFSMQIFSGNELDVAHEVYNI
jgi:hypothetical protein